MAQNLARHEKGLEGRKVYGNPVIAGLKKLWRDLKSIRWFVRFPKWIGTMFKALEPYITAAICVWVGVLIGWETVTPEHTVNQWIRNNVQQQNELQKGIPIDERIRDNDRKIRQSS